MKFSLLGLGCLFCATTLFAKLELPQIFSDNMVLQSRTEVLVWGKAAAHANICLEFAGQKQSCAADAKGDWRINLSPLQKSFKPAQMRILENGSEAALIENILVGEVWICGGQSNMAFPLKNSDGGGAAAKSLKGGNLRAFMQPSRVGAQTPQFKSPQGASWIIVTPENAGNLSAAAFYFAKTILSRIETPVGLVHTATGGAKMVCWIPNKDIAGVAAFEADLKKLEDLRANYDYEAALAKWKKDVAYYKEKVAKAKAEGQTPPATPWFINIAPVPESPLTISATPSFLYNAKIAPLAGFAARGVIWYQGEADAALPPADFQAMFARVIKSWRELWNDDDLPFYFAQLPSYEMANWENARLAQSAVAASVKNTHMAVHFDTGEKSDIHPHEKLPIGERLGNLALKYEYGAQDLKPDSAEALSASFDGSNAAVSVNTHGKKLSFKGEARGFEVLTKSGWQPAAIKLEVDDKIIISSKNGAEILGLRYAWKAWAKPDVCVFDCCGLPMRAFLFKKAARNQAASNP